MGFGARLGCRAGGLCWLISSMGLVFGFVFGVVEGVDIYICLGK